MNKSFIVLLFGICAALLSSAIPIPKTDVWYSQYVAVLLFMTLMFAIDMFRFMKSLGVFVAYIIFSTVFVAKQDLISVMCLFPTLFAFYLIRLIAGLDRKSRKRIFKTLFVLLCIQIVWGILQKYNIDPIFRSLSNSAICDTTGFSGSHNQYGLFLAATTSAALYLNVYWMLPLIFIAIVISKTLTAYIGFALSCLFFFASRWNHRPRLIFCVAKLSIIPIVFCVLFVLLVPKGFNTKFAERFDLWKLSTTQVLKGRAAMNVVGFENNTKMTIIKTCSPLLGYGFGQFFKISPYTQEKIIRKPGQHRYEHAHNDYVEVLFDLGLIGVALLGWIFYEMLILFKKAAKTPLLIASTCGIIAYAVCASAIYTVHTATGGFFLAVFVGLFLAEARNGT